MRTTTKEREGVIVSDKMDKTVTVEITKVILHPFYGKPIKRRSKIKAHDEKNECHIGDRVRIQEYKPISKTKSWRVVEVLVRAVSEGA
jgi:small subunit ribosomal protein S17